jgi:hypothetical protein
MIPEVRDQDGVVTRQQLLAHGVTHARIRAQLVAGRWRRLSPGVYATFTGPLPDRARVWAAVLRAGPGAVAGPATSLWLAGLAERAPAVPDVLIPEHRRVRGAAGARVVRRRGLAAMVHPSSQPPRLRVEEAVLDRCGAYRRAAPVVDLVLRAVQRGLTTADRLTSCLRARPGHRWRGLLLELCADVTVGVRSALERRWLHDVARPHRLPAAVLNHPDASGSRRRYRDLEFLGWPLVVELDGRESHPDAERFRDRQRDNSVTVSGRRTLRYGRHELAEDPCGVAAEVVAVLRTLGWTGAAAPCSPHCTVVADDRGRSSDNDRPHADRTRTGA